MNPLWKSYKQILRFLYVLLQGKTLNSRCWNGLDVPGNHADAQQFASFLRSSPSGDAAKRRSENLRKRLKPEGTGCHFHTHCIQSEIILNVIIRWKKRSSSQSRVAYDIRWDTRLVRQGLISIGGGVIEHLPVRETAWHFIIGGYKTLHKCEKMHRDSPVGSGCHAENTIRHKQCLFNFGSHVAV